MTLTLPTVDAALIKVIGVFAYKRTSIQNFIDIGFHSIPLVDEVPQKATSDSSALLKKKIEDTKKFYKDTYYKTFGSLMFTGESDIVQMRALHRKEIFAFNFRLNRFDVKNQMPIHEQINVQCTCQELFLFDNETGILALTINPENLDFSAISNTTYLLKSFDSIVYYQSEELEFHAFISKELFKNKIELRGAHVLADEYSGSKFKIYTIINTLEPNDGACYCWDKLAFEIGTGSKIGEIHNDGFNAPTQMYFEETMKNKISVFRNYTGLALVDSFTLIGQGVYQTKEVHIHKFNTYNRIYFAIYIYNLYLKYNIFRFNTIFQEDPIKTRDDFQLFMNLYNFSHISFNFLPNIFYKNIHQALDIDNEIAQFEKRLTGLATRLQEQQEKRQATLLGIISGITAISTINDFKQLSESFRVQLNWSYLSFYSLLLIILFIFGLVSFFYLFPETTRKILKKVRSKKKRIVP
jgi:hypothetical protein